MIDTVVRAAEQQRIETLKRQHRDHYDPQCCDICLFIHALEAQKSDKRKFVSYDD